MDNRRNFRLLEDIEEGRYDPGAVSFSDEKTYRKNANRLSNVRFPIGEEPWPDVEGTSKDDPWVNIKLEVTEHADPDPDQRNMLHGGAELKMKCHYDGTPYHVSAERTARQVLEGAGYVFREDVKNLDAKVVACVCEHGHVMQLRGDMVERLLV